MVGSACRISVRRRKQSKRVSTDERQPIAEGKDSALAKLQLRQHRFQLARVCRRHRTPSNPEAGSLRRALGVECGAPGGGGHDRQRDAAGFVAQSRGKIRSRRVLSLIRTIGDNDMRAHSIGDGIAIGIAQQKPGVERIFQQRRVGAGGCSAANIVRLEASVTAQMRGRMRYMKNLHNPELRK